MLSDGCHVEIVYASAARASVSDVVFSITIDAYLCIVPVRFQNLIAGSHCANLSFCACFSFLFLDLSLEAMVTVVMPMYVCFEVVLIFMYTTCEWENVHHE